MSKRKVPKLNRDNFLAWKYVMKLHLGVLGDHVKSIITIDHVDHIGDLTTKDLKKRKNTIRTCWRFPLP